MNIWETINDVVLVILGCVVLFVLCCMWIVCQEEIKAWWKRRKEKDD